MQQTLAHTTRTLTRTLWGDLCLDAKKVPRVVGMEKSVVSLLLSIVLQCCRPQLLSWAIQLLCRTVGLFFLKIVIVRIISLLPGGFYERRTTKPFLHAAHCRTRNCWPHYGHYGHLVAVFFDLLLYCLKTRQHYTFNTLDEFYIHTRVRVHTFSTCSVVSTQDSTTRTTPHTKLTYI